MDAGNVSPIRTLGTFWQPNWEAKGGWLETFGTFRMIEIDLPNRMSYLIWNFQGGIRRGRRREMASGFEWAILRWFSRFWNQFEALQGMILKREIILIDRRGSACCRIIGLNFRSKIWTWSACPSYRTVCQPYLLFSKKKVFCTALETAKESFNQKFLTVQLAVWWLETLQ